MYQHSTLFCLFGRMPANAYERIDYVFECIDIVVEDNEVHGVSSLDYLQHIFHYFFLIAGSHCARIKDNKGIQFKGFPEYLKDGSGVKSFVNERNFFAVLPY